MAKTNNNSLKLQRAVRSLFYDYQEKKGCLGTTYAQAACGCDNALQMWRGPKGEKGDPGPQGPKGDNAGSFLVSAEFVVNPAGQPEGSYLKLVLIDVAQQEQVVYVNLSELEDVYSAGNGIDITSMVIAAKLGAGLTFDQQGNITSAYQFCDGLDETSNVVKVKLDAGNNILGFAGSGCKGLTATVNLTQAASGVALVLTGASGAVLSTIPLEGGTGITIQKDAQGGGFTWLVDFSGVISSTAGNNLTISDNKLYVGNSALSYTVGDGTFTLTNAAGGTSTVTLPTVVRSLDRADLVCEGENAPYLRLTFKRDNGQNLYQDVSLACLASALDVISGVTLDIDTDGCIAPPCNSVTTVVPEGEPILCKVTLMYLTEQRYNAVVAGTEPNVDDEATISTNHGEATVTTGDLSSYYAVCIEAAVQDCCSIACRSTDQYLSPNIMDVPTTLWEAPSYPIPISTLLAAGDEGIELSLGGMYGSEPMYGTDKLIVVATANQDGSLTLSFKICKPAITGCFVVPGLPEPYTANPGIVLSGAISVNGTFILGEAHTGNNRMEEIQAYSTELNSFTVTNSTGSDGPIDITLLIDGARSDDFWDYFRLSVPSWSAFVAAGEAGFPMEEDCGSCGYYYEGGDYPPVCIKFFGKKMYLSCTDEGNNVYRLYPFVMPQYTEVAPEEPEGLKADLVIVNAGGSETRVDMKPLLSQVGGSVIYNGSEKVLRLGPSCSSDIPLADLGGISGASLDVQCETVTHSTRVPFEHFNQFDILSSDGDSSIGSAYGTDSVFTVTVSDNAGYGELSLISRFQMNADGDNAYVLSGPGTFEDLIADSPVLMTEQRCSQYSGIPCGLKVWVSCVSNGNSSYTFTFTTGEADTTEPVLTTDLVIENVAGTEARVDMTPLLTKIGGKIENRPVGEPVPVPLAAQDVAGLTPNFVGYYKTAQDVCDDTGVNPSSGSADATSVYVYFTSANMPQYVRFVVYLVDENRRPVDSVYYVNEFDLDNCADINCSISAMLEGDVVLRGFDSDTELPVDGKVLYLRCETVFDQATEKSGYKFTFLQAATSPALCLEPSCDPCIDLTPAIGDAITSVSGTVSCDGTVTPFEDGAYINGEYSDASNHAISGISESVSSNAQVTFELPQGTATLFPTVWIADPNDSNMSYSYVFSNGIPVSELTVGARFCSDERMHGYTPH